MYFRKLIHFHHRGVNVMKKLMLVLMIVFCIGMEGKTKKSAISVLLHDGKTRKRNFPIRFCAILP